MEPSSSSPVTALERLNDASHRAIELVHRLASEEPPRSEKGANDSSSGNTKSNNNNKKNKNDNNNPWANPESIQEQLVAARGDLESAWNKLRSTTQTNLDDDDDNDNDNEQDDDDDDDDDKLSDEEFRALYIETMTDAFGDVLQQTMQSSSSSNNSNTDDDEHVELLVDCLQSGMDLLDPDQLLSRSYFASLVGETEMETTETTVHEARQRALGYLTGESSPAMA
mmetsp:Transcript_6884/g.17259  ORF Transcript_6884/g.17259 Transcript_6884/m.17259 type:complete len:225 (-) Transcript_6884:533-1207(-)